MALEKQLFLYDCRLVQPNSGNIYLDDLNITDYPMYKRAQQGIGYLAQEASVFRKLSIEDNILSVLQLTKLSKEEQVAKMESLIAEFSLEHIRTNRGDLLSEENVVVKLHDA
jgi:lipopolysaccharide export system ATP-binding protein